MSGPDFTHGGQFVDWGDDANTLDDRFVPFVELARLNIGTDVELVRWSPDDPLVRQFEQWWARQGRAIRRHVGPVAGVKVTTRSRLHRDHGVKIAYVRFNRVRPSIVAGRDEVAS
jgi:hypothetical protein